MAIATEPATEVHEIDVSSIKPVKQVPWTENVVSGDRTCQGLKSRNRVWQLLGGGGSYGQTERHDQAHRGRAGSSPTLRNTAPGRGL